MNFETEKFLMTTGDYVTGVNYLASNAGISMWSEWDEACVEKDFEVMAGYGVRVIRVFPIWADFQPITMLRKHCAPGGQPMGITMGKHPLPDTPLGRAGLCEEMMRRFERLTDLAEKYGFKLIVPLLTGHITFQLIVPPALEGMDVFTHPTSIKWQKRFVAAFVDHFKNRDAIVAWEPGNECSCMSKAQSPEAAWLWLSTITDTIRLHDNSRPVFSGMHSLALSETSKDKWLLADQAELCDMLTPHPYPCWKSWANCDPCNTIRNTMHAVTEKRFYSDISQKPAFIEEIGTWRPVFSNLETHADTMRNILWNTWAHDSRGLLWWCAFDQTHLDAPPYNWDWPGLEHGMFTVDRKPYPAANELANFRTFLDSLPFDRLPLAETDAICILGGDIDHIPLAHGCMLLAQQAGINIEFQSSRQPLRDKPLYLLPSTHGRMGLSPDAWHNLKEKVKAGAALYISLNDTYLDSLSEVFGAEVEIRTLNQQDRVYRFNLEDEEFELEACPKAHYKMNAAGAEVKGSDSNGNPVFFEGNYGQGKVYLLALPIEEIMLNTPGSYHAPKTRDAWKIYQYIAKQTLPAKIIEKQNRMTTVTIHHRSSTEAVAVVVNNSAETVEESLKTAPGWQIISVLPESLSWSNKESVLKIKLSKNSGTVIIIKKQ